MFLESIDEYCGCFGKSSVALQHGGQTKGDAGCKACKAQVWAVVTNGDGASASTAARTNGDGTTGTNGSDTVVGSSAKDPVKRTGSIVARKRQKGLVRTFRDMTPIKERTSRSTYAGSSAGTIPSSLSIRRR
ncbi:Uu.00g032030.m01.CDS01 [Anthostomella pinea]|uniref:Uu.00g032030.m01.CDS01 n=1 Tax=Anthostomella pinea TaxID=933095 RepID=A0AAI8V9L6_9PEZI|nr:Uu.00g032030.m01.CDS01 [Anthostomella pinea]